MIEINGESQKLKHVHFTVQVPEWMDEFQILGYLQKLLKTGDEASIQSLREFCVEPCVADPSIALSGPELAVCTDGLAHKINQHEAVLGEGTAVATRAVKSRVDQIYQITRLLERPSGK